MAALKPATSDFLDRRLIMVRLEVSSTLELIPLISILGFQSRRGKER